MLVQILIANNCWNRMVSSLRSSERGAPNNPYLNQTQGLNNNNNMGPNHSEVFPSSNNYYESHKIQENIPNVPPAGYTGNNSYSNYPSLGEINHNNKN